MKTRAVDPPGKTKTAKRSQAPVRVKAPVKVNDWIITNAVWLELAIIAAGAILRIIAANGTYLNPDEALHYVLAHQENPLAVYRASLTNAHPPLYFLLLYLWRFLGSSELFLRLPSVIAGVALIVVGTALCKR